MTAIAVVSLLFLGLGVLAWVCDSIPVRSDDDRSVAAHSAFRDALGGDGRWSQ